MAYRYAFRPSPPLAFVRFAGDLTGPVLVEATEALFGNAAWPFGADAVWDFTAVGRVVLDTDDLAATSGAVALHQPHIGPGRSVLVTTDPSLYTLGRLYAHRWAADGRTVETAPTLADACVHLGITPADLPPLPDGPPQPAGSTGRRRA